MSRLPVPLLPRWLRWTSVVAVVSVIVYFSVFRTVPAPPSGPMDLAQLWDKQLHFAAYAGFAYSLAYATVESRHRPRRRIGGVLATALLFGLAIELIQGTLPMRYYSSARRKPTASALDEADNRETFYA